MKLKAKKIDPRDKPNPSTTQTQFKKPDSPFRETKEVPINVNQILFHKSTTQTCSGKPFFPTYKISSHASSSESSWIV